MWDLIDTELPPPDHGVELPPPDHGVELPEPDDPETLQLPPLQLVFRWINLSLVMDVCMHLSVLCLQLCCCCQ